MRAGARLHGQRSLRPQHRQHHPHDGKQTSVPTSVAAGTTFVGCFDCLRTAVAYEVDGRNNWARLTLTFLSPIPGATHTLARRRRSLWDRSTSRRICRSSITRNPRPLPHALDPVLTHACTHLNMHARTQTPNTPPPCLALPLPSSNYALPLPSISSPLVFQESEEGCDGLHSLGQL